MSRFAFHQDKLVPGHAAGKVFEDPKQRRGHRVTAIFLMLVTGLLCWVYLFLDGTLSWKAAVQELNPFRSAEQTGSPSYGGSPGELENMYLASSQPAPKPAGQCSGNGKQPYFSAMADTTAPKVFAHVPVALDRAYLSLEDSCGQAGVVVPEWISIGESRGAPAVSVIGKDTRISVEEYIAAAEYQPELLPAVLLNTAESSAGFLEALAGPEQTVAVAAGLAAAAEGLNAQGACLDLSGLKPAEARQLLPLAKQFSEVFRGQGLKACLVLSGAQPLWRDAELAAGFDQIVLKMFQQPWTGSVPGPLAADSWFAEVAAEAAQAVGTGKLVAALGSFAVEWTSGSPAPAVLSYAEAMQQIEAAGAGVHFSSRTSNSFSRFRDAEGRQRKIWMLDAASVHNQLAALKDLGVGNVALWSLGLEDPGVWEVLQHQGDTKDVLAAELTVVGLDNYIGYEGEGALFRIRQKAAAGVRHVEFDPASGRISGQDYTQLPQPYLIERYGRPDSRRIVLTFDDGPHPEYTKEILDILREEKVQGSFFVVGTSIMEAPELVNRMVAEGHEIGAHTFSHPRMDLISGTRRDLEFSLLDRILAGASGRKSMLYREPFQRSGGPIKAERVTSLVEAEARGFAIAGMDIVPKDWEGWTSQEIAGFVIDQVEQGAGNVILLHDGGEDRSASVGAVRPIITALRAKGYEFTTLAGLMGAARADVMPVAEGGSPVFDRVSFSMVWFVQQSVVFVFWAVLAIGLLRSAGILIMAILSRREKYLPLQRQPRVAVIIPAHNEAKVIAKSVESVRASGYKNLEIIVVDDGSTDDTLIEVLKFGHKSEVRLISQPNQGKWSALNRAVLSTDAEFVVCIDADTQIRKGAIAHLMRHFADPQTGAVAGKIIAGNRVNLLTRLQAFEYATSQNVERRAFSLINGILVVPGAIGAWRVEALKKAGLFSDETLTEDTDLTIQLNRSGYRVVYEPRAKAYTEVPEKTRQLLQQRLRWSLGMFQSAWKHKRAIAEGRPVGLVSISDMFVFGYVFPLLAPIADLFVILMLYKLAAGGWEGDVGASQVAAPVQYLWAYLALPAMELLIAAYAIATDEDESLWSLLLFPVQRLLYRPLMYFSVIRSILRAVTGRLASWGTLKRQGRDYGLVTEST